MSRYDSLRKLDRNQQLFEYRKQNPSASQKEISQVFGMTPQRVSQIFNDPNALGGKEIPMARRRMVDPAFFEDDQVGRLSYSERLLLMAAWVSADDEGRLRAHPGHLRGLAFTYDEVSLEEIADYRNKAAETLSKSSLYAFVVYKDDRGSEYMAFTNWSKTNKPSHPKPSDIPAPPQIKEVDRDGDGDSPEGFRIIAGELPESLENNSSKLPEDLENNSREFPEAFAPRSGEGRGGKVSQGQVRLGEVSGNKEDSSSLPEGLREEIEKFLSHDLTDFDDLIDYEFLEFAAAAAAGKVSAAGSHALTWWETWMGELNGRKGKSAGQAVLQGVMDACRQHPPALVAAALLKAGRYEGGAQKSWTYAKKIMAEMNGNAATGPP